VEGTEGGQTMTPKLSLREQLKNAGCLEDYYVFRLPSKKGRTWIETDEVLALIDSLAKEIESRGWTRDGDEEDVDDIVFVQDVLRLLVGEKVKREE
jgi:hypothetical protein